MVEKTGAAWRFEFTKREGRKLRRPLAYPLGELCTLRASGVAKVVPGSAQCLRGGGGSGGGSLLPTTLLSFNSRQSGSGCVLVSPRPSANARASTGLLTQGDALQVFS